MKKTELEIIETTILLLDGGKMEVLKNGLLPHLNKAEKIVEIIRK
jgi:hypothetical protein